MRDWNSPIYAFFKPTPAIKYIQGRRLHVFECTATSCSVAAAPARSQLIAVADAGLEPSRTEPT